MKKIFTSPIHSWSPTADYAERIHVYEVENEDEHQRLDNMSYEELCYHFCVPQEPCFSILPGAQFSSYSFRLFDTHIIVSEWIGYNV